MSHYDLELSNAQVAAVEEVTEDDIDNESSLKYIAASMEDEEFRGFLRGNILKYTTRYRNKGGVADLEKAQRYLSGLIEFEKRVQEKL